MRALGVTATTPPRTRPWIVRASLCRAVPYRSSQRQVWACWACALGLGLGRIGGFAPWGEGQTLPTACRGRGRPAQQAISGWIQRLDAVSGKSVLFLGHLVIKYQVSKHWNAWYVLHTSNQALTRISCYPPGWTHIMPTRMLRSVTMRQGSIFPMDSTYHSTINSRIRRPRQDRIAGNVGDLGT